MNVWIGVNVKTPNAIEFMRIWSQKLVNIVISGA